MLTAASDKGGQAFLQPIQMALKTRGASNGDLLFYGKCSRIETRDSEPMTDERDLVPRFVRSYVVRCERRRARREAAERPRLFRQIGPRDIFERCRTESMPCRQQRLLSAEGITCGMNRGVNC
jgi:hypothetical protein